MTHKLPDPDSAIEEWEDCIGRWEYPFIMEGTMRKHRRWQEIVVARDITRFEALRERIARGQRASGLLRAPSSAEDWLLFFVGLNGPSGGIFARFKVADHAFQFALLQAELKGIERVEEVFPSSPRKLEAWLDTIPPNIHDPNFGARTPRQALRDGDVEAVIQLALVGAT